MRPFRSSEGIIADILTLAQSKVTKTRIMYGANLSYTQLKRYLAIVTEKGFVAHDDTDGLYYITQKGREVLDSLSKTKELLA